MTVHNIVKKRIENMSYEDMLRSWRFAPIGDKRFLGEIGDYFIKIMTQKRIEIGPEQHTAISKRIGWTPPV